MFQINPRTTVSDEERKFVCYDFNTDIIVKELESVPLEEVNEFYNEHIHQTKKEDRRFLYDQIADRYYDTVYHRHVTINTAYYRNKKTGKLFDQGVILNMFKKLLDEFEKQLKLRGFVTSLDELFYLNDRGLVGNVNYHPNQPKQQRNDMYPQQQPMQMAHPQQMAQQPMMPQQQPMYNRAPQPTHMMHQQPMQQMPVQMQMQPQPMLAPDGTTVYFVGHNQYGQPVYFNEQQMYQLRQQQMMHPNQMQQMPQRMQQTQMAQAINSGGNSGMFNNGPVQQPMMQNTPPVPLDERAPCFVYGRQVHLANEQPAKAQNDTAQMGGSLFRRREPEDAKPQQQQVVQEPVVQPTQQPTRHPNMPANVQPPRPMPKWGPDIDLPGSVEYVNVNGKFVRVDSPNNDYQANMPGRGQNAPAHSRFPENDVDYQHVEQEFRPPWPGEAYMTTLFNDIVRNSPELEYLRDRFYMLFENIRTALSKYPAENTFIRMLGQNMFGNYGNQHSFDPFNLYLHRLCATGKAHDAQVAEQEAVNLLAWYIKSATCIKHSKSDRSNIAERKALYECPVRPLNSQEIDQLERRFAEFNINNQNLIKRYKEQWLYKHNDYVADLMEAEQKNRWQENARQEIRQSDHEQLMQHNARIEAEKAQKLREEQEELERQQQTNMVMQQLRAICSDDVKEKKANRAQQEQMKLESDQAYDEMIANSISSYEAPQASKPEYELVDDIAWLAANNGQHIYLPGVDPYQERMEYRKYPDGSVRYCIMQMSDAECKQARDEAIRNAAMVGDIITEESLDQNNYPKVVVQNGTVELVDDGGFDVEEIPIDSIGDSIDTKVTLLLAEAENVERKSHLVRYEDGSQGFVEQTDYEYMPVVIDHMYVTKHRACVRDNDGDKDVFKDILKCKTLKDVAKYINTIRKGNSKRNSKQAADLANELITQRINDFINDEIVISGEFHVENFVLEADSLLDRIEREVNDFTREKVEEYQNYIIQSAYCNDVDLQTIVESMGKDDAKTANIVGITQLHSVAVINQTAAQLGLNSAECHTGKPVKIRSDKVRDIVKSIFEHDEKRNIQHREQYGKDQYVARRILATSDNQRFIVSRTPKYPEVINPVYYIRVMN